MNRFPLTLGVLPALLLAACGGSPAAAPASSAAAPLSVAMGHPVDNSTQAPVHVAADNGYFELMGAKVDQKVLGGSSQTNAALVGGSIQFATTSTIAFLLARKAGVPLYAVESILSGAQMQVVVSNQWAESHGLTKDQPLDTRIKALQGAQFGSIGSSDRGYLQFLFGKVGLPSDAARLVTMQSASDLTTALSNNTINAFITSPPNSYVAEEKGQGKVLIDSVPPWDDVEYFLLVTTSDYAKQHPDVVKAVATAVAKGNNQVLKHPDDAVAIERKHFPSFSEDTMKRSVAALKFSPDGLQSAAEWSQASTLFQQTGLTDSLIEVKEGTDWSNQFVDKIKAAVN
jgi:ABC-type nitrate/sulfonate/bicarbonate transport system substrate-binding protein